MQNSRLRTDTETNDAPLDSAVLDRYVGDYAPYGGEFGLYSITRAGANLLMQVTGQPSFELYSRGGVEFSPTVVDARIEFVGGAGNEVTGLVLRQAGAEITAERIDPATAEQLRARLAARIESKRRTPGSEEALRRLIEGIRAGAPDYEEMSPGFARVLQRQVPRLQEIAQYLGGIRSLDFQGVGSQGWDVYEVRRENGSSRWRIALASDGKIIGAVAVVTSPTLLLSDHDRPGVESSASVIAAARTATG